MIPKNGIISWMIGFEESILSKCRYYPKQSTYLMQYLSKHPCTFHRTKTNETQNLWNHKRALLWKQCWGRKTKLKVSCSLISESSTKLIKIAWYWHTYSQKTYRLMGQNKEPEKKPHTQGKLIYNKGWKDIQWRKDNLFKKLCWEKGTDTHKRIKLEPSLISLKK